MKVRHIALIRHIALKCLMFVACLLVAGEISYARAQEWANKMFDHLEYDFGNLARGATSEHRFKITNGFKEDIQISSIKSSCGCTNPKLTKKTLSSGEEAELIVEFDTVKFKGAHTATVTVVLAPPYSAEIRLKITGFVRQDIVFQPGRIEFGQVPANEGSSQNIAITYAGRSDWEIADVRSASENFEVELRSPSRSDGRVEYDMLVRLKKEAPTGYIKDQLTLITNDQVHHFIPIAIEANVVPAISVSPASLHLGVVRPGESVTKQLVVRGTSPFRILDVACEKEDDCFKFAPGDKERKVHLIPVTFTASESTGKIVETIQITTAGAGNEELEVVAHVEVLEK